MAEMGQGKPAPAELERLLGYHFNDAELLRLALTHRSYLLQGGGSDKGPAGKGGQRHNERLEFLGDAVLNLVISHLLYQRFPEAPEGVLSHWRATLVNTRNLSLVGESLHLGEHLRLGRGESQSGGRGKSSILGDGMEAVLGALFLDGGHAACAEVVARLFAGQMDVIRPGDVEKDDKTLLQERLQAVGRPLPHYRVIATNGEPHARTFEVECQVPGILAQRGQGSSKRAAEQEAARAVLNILEQDTPDKETAATT